MDGYALASRFGFRVAWRPCFGYVSSLAGRDAGLVTKGDSAKGKAVYDSPGAVLVQTTPDETVRITGEELQSRRKAEVSLMPPGLLMGLTDAELADLHAYLRSLH